MGAEERPLGKRESMLTAALGITTCSTFMALAISHEREITALFACVASISLHPSLIALLGLGWCSGRDCPVELAYVGFDLHCDVVFQRRDGLSARRLSALYEHQRFGIGPHEAARDDVSGSGRGDGLGRAA